MKLMTKRCAYKLSLALLALVLTACAARLQPSSTTATGMENFPAAYYREARAQGIRVLDIDSTRSLLAITVRRSGRLAKLGHDHVIASHNVNGFVAPDIGRADMFVTLNDLTVDEAPLLAEAGFTSPAAPGVAEATRKNMLEKVLDVLHFPTALIHVSRDAQDSSNLKVTITLHGVTQHYLVPAKIESQDGALIAIGEMTFRQTDFGITPLSVLNGALRVEDELKLRFRIVSGK